MIVDPAVRGWQDLVAGLPAGSEVLVLDPSRSGLAQIADALGVTRQAVAAARKDFDKFLTDALFTLMGAPSEAEPHQLRDVHIKLELPKKAEPVKAAG